MNATQRTRRSLMLLPGLLLAGSLLTGCVIGEGGSDNQTVEEDIEEYEQLKDELFGDASVFVSGAAQTFRAADNTLYWIDAGAGNPLLKSYDDNAGTQLTHSFSPYLVAPSSSNPIDNLNYVVSSGTVASMNELDGANVYRAGTEGELIFKTTLPAPPYGQKWWAYSLDGEALYVTVIVDNEYVVQKWLPGVPEPSAVANLTQLIAPNVMGEFLDFAVSGDQLIFSESGRIWLVDLPGAEARWVQNDERVSQADFDASGAVYNQDEEFWRYDWASDTRENLSERMRAGYKMNKTYDKAHHPTNFGGWFKHGSSLTYVGNSGLFAFDLNSGDVKPVLLNERDNSRVYRVPIVLDNGTLFVKSLESESGATGADGPTYRVGS